MAGVAWSEILGHAYAQGTTDEFVMPALMVADGVVKRGDGIVFFNFRPDRARQLTDCFINPAFAEFEHEDLCSTTGSLAFFISTGLYKEEFKAFKNDVLFKRELVEHTLLDELAHQVQPHKVFIIAETEKYAHVTYFFRGMVDKQLPHEERVLVPSVKVKSYADHPQMSAPLITQYVVHSLEKDPAYFYLVNYANLDMVGHSGDFKATVQACQVIDQQLATLYHVLVEQCNGTMFIVGDHGNAEEKVDAATGAPLTAHTINPVPFVVVSRAHLCGAAGAAELEFVRPEYGLASVAPTILKHLKLTVPEVMEQPILFRWEEVYGV
jgi:2,3-bisphosphoglycerate-independent phosphoglycerate mutase